MRPQPNRRRAGFTLVELLVAVGLMILLVALAVSVLRAGAGESQRIVQSADRVSGWLLVAKQRALRDGQPRGVRFYVTGTSPNQRVTEMEYIEEPLPFVPNPDQDPLKGRIALAYEHFTNGAIVRRRCYYVDTVSAGPYTDFDAAVSDGSSLAIPQYGGVFRVRGTIDTTNTPATLVFGGTSVNIPVRRLPLATFPDLGAGAASTANPSPTNPADPADVTAVTYQFSFQATPQPLLGEPLLVLPETAAVDMSAGTTTGVTVANNRFDILFAPSGQVLNNTSAFIALWVRDLTKDGVSAGQFDEAGEQQLVVVYPRTGAIAVQPVARDTSNPYRLALDGINGGV